MIRKIALVTTAMVTLAASGAAFAGDNNKAFVDQYNTSQAINIDQTGGSYNTIGSSSRSVRQENGGLGGGNLLNITQSGSGNTFGLYAYSYQSGQSNRADINQSGTQSNVEVAQSGQNNGNNTYGQALSLVNQAAAFSDVNVVSNGIANAFQVYQGSTNNQVDGGQQGQGNILVVNQGFSLGGSFNIVSATQSANGNTARLTQFGDHNSSSLAQSGDGNTADVFQSTNNSMSSVTQTGTSNGASVTQYGNSNNSTINQYASLGNAYVYQSGNNDISVLTQQNGLSNTASIIQTGSNNQSYLGQNGSNNQVTVNQGGNYNVATLNQIGNSNAANIRQ